MPTDSRSLGNAIQAAISKLTFGPAFPLREPKVYWQYRADRDVFRLSVSWVAPDAETGVESRWSVVRDVYVQLGAFDPNPEDLVVRFVNNMWREAVMHELGESLFFDGKLVTDPHERKNHGPQE